jgi:hypothetical protein
MSDSGREWPSEVTPTRAELEQQLQAQRDEIEQWKTWGIIEIAVRNPESPKV